MFVEGLPPEGQARQISALPAVALRAGSFLLPSEDAHLMPDDAHFVTAVKLQLRVPHLSDDRPRFCQHFNAEKKTCCGAPLDKRGLNAR